MRLARIIPILLTALCALSSTDAAALTIGTGTPVMSVPNGDKVVLTNGGSRIPQGDTEITLSGDYNIYTDGDMFLDYSVFGGDQTLSIGAGISMTGQTITIFSFEEPPTFPDLSRTTVFANPAYNMNEIGDILLFSQAPVFSGLFEATGNLYVGNYSSLQPVPLPAGAILLASGLAALGGGVAVSRRAVRASPLQLTPTPAV